MEQDELNEKKEKISKLIGNREKLLFLAVFAFGIILRLYYFFLTKDQPLWWDEADYMAYAKNIAGIDNFWSLSPQHESIYPYLAALFFKLSISEPFIRFFLALLPSIIILFLTYKICITVYNDKRIALISTFLMAVFWELLFNNMRFQIENLAMVFAFLSIYIFFKGYENKQKFFKIDPKWALPVVGFLVVLTYTIRRGFFIFGFFFLFYMLFTKNIKDLIKDKYNWFALLVVVLLIILSELFVFTSPVSEIAGTYHTQGATFNLIPLQIFNVYFDDTSNNISVLFYLFYIGAIIIIANLLLSVGYIKKSEINLKPDLFWILTIVVTLGYFLFYQMRIDNVGDPRWYYPLLLGGFVCISKSTLFIADFIKKYNKILSVIFIIGIIGYGGFYELQHADMIIKNKLTSYQGIKDASLYIKEISNSDDIIISVPTSQPAYYAERQVAYPAYFLNKTSSSETTFEEFLQKVQKNESVKYIIVTFSEPNHPDWMRHDEFIQDQITGQMTYSKISIPFSQTTIDFATGAQNIPPEVSYGNIKFKLLEIYGDAFVYEIVRV